MSRIDENYRRALLGEILKTVTDQVLSRKSPTAIEMFDAKQAEQIVHVAYLIADRVEEREVERMKNFEVKYLEGQLHVFRDYAEKRDWRKVGIHISSTAQTLTRPGGSPVFAELATKLGEMMQGKGVANMNDELTAKVIEAFESALHQYADDPA